MQSEVVMNEFEVMLVIEDLRKREIENYTMQPGNECIWVSFNRGSSTLHFYYIFREGRIIDIQID